MLFRSGFFPTFPSFNRLLSSGISTLSFWNPHKLARTGKNGFVCLCFFSGFPSHRQWLLILLCFSYLALQKELKRLAKAQQAGALGLSPVTQPLPIQVSIPTSATGPTFRPTDAPTPRTGGTTTPRSALASGTPRPGSHVLKSGSTNPKSGSTVDPRPVPRPGSTAPVSAPPPPTARPTLPPVQVPTARVGTPLRTATPTSAHPIDQRGKKRERDDSIGVGINGLPINGVSKENGVGAAPVNGNGIASNNVVNAKPGTGTIRPRPIKKQRMV